MTCGPQAFSCDKVASVHVSQQILHMWLLQTAFLNVVSHNEKKNIFLRNGYQKVSHRGVSRHSSTSEGKKLYILFISEVKL